VGPLRAYRAWRDKIRIGKRLSRAKSAKGAKAKNKIIEARIPKLETNSKQEIQNNDNVPKRDGTD
jgi:hypothetical protein